TGAPPAAVLPYYPGRQPSPPTLTPRGLIPTPPSPILEWSVPNPFAPVIEPMLLPWLPQIRSSKVHLILPPASAWSPPGTSSGGGGGAGQTGCCPNMPGTLNATLHVQSGVCNCLHGLIVPLSGNPTTCWTGSATTSCSS